jgi:hypothetical protein
MCKIPDAREGTFENGVIKAAACSPLGKRISRETARAFIISVVSVG